MAQSTNYTKPTANEVLLCNNVGVGEDGRNEILIFFDTRSGLALALEMKYWSITNGVLSNIGLYLGTFDNHKSITATGSVRRLGTHTVRNYRLFTK